MPLTRKDLHVLIVGGGLAGLALAQALRAKSVSCDIFERDASEVARTQGWAITLHADMIENFKHSMPCDMPELQRVNHLDGFDIAPESAVFRAPTDRLEELIRLGPKYGQDQIRASRGKLRKWLMTNIPIKWNKRFSQYVEDADGVTAYFEDGTSYRGHILVGADGVHSRVRRQLIPDMEPQPLPMGAMLGELVATKEQYERWMRLGVSWVSAFAEDLRVTFLCSSIASDTMTANYYWLFGWHDKEAVRDDYWSLKASKEQLHDWMLRNVHKLHPDIAEVFQATPVDGIVLPALRLVDMMPPQLPESRITLIGDAVHPMTPFRGQGGNVAMADGLSLAHFIQSAPPDEIIARTLKRYEDEMQPRASAVVAESRGGSYVENARPKVMPILPAMR